METIVGGGYLKTNNLDEILLVVNPNFALVDSKSVCGIEHLSQAGRLSLVSHSNGFNLSKDKSTEVLLYLTAQRQISKALKLAGVTSKTKSVGWVSFGAVPSKLLSMVKTDVSVLSSNNFDYSNFAKDIDKNFDNDLKQKIIMTRTASLPTQTR